jgi:hypothetical protein
MKSGFCLYKMMDKVKKNNSHKQVVKSGTKREDITHCSHSSYDSHDLCKFINKLPIADNARVDVQSK